MVEGGTVPRAVHLPGRICTGCTSWKGHSCCLPLCLSRLRFSYTLFTAKLDERRKRDGMERDRSAIATPHPPFCIFHPQNSINAPRWSSFRYRPLSIETATSFLDSSTLKIEFFLIMVPNETGITRLPLPPLPSPSLLSKRRCLLPRYQAVALEDR